ncbi:hypothetical protein B0H11DRAFT_2295198 [Mycena galericulata]|nr:hypothetical protein B0H11DRAFT_2295198 [Mycena galericulata]
MLPRDSLDILGTTYYHYFLRCLSYHSRNIYSPSKMPRALHVGWFLSVISIIYRQPATHVVYVLQIYSVVFGNFRLFLSTEWAMGGDGEDLDGANGSARKARFSPPPIFDGNLAGGGGDFDGADGSARKARFATPPSIFDGDVDEIDVACFTIYYILIYLRFYGHFRDARFTTSPPIFDGDPGTGKLGGSGGNFDGRDGTVREARFATLPPIFDGDVNEIDGGAPAPILPPSSAL